MFDRPDRSILEGTLHFNRSYSGLTIEDAYQIRLELPYKDGSRPHLEEIGGRLKSVFCDHPEFTSLADIHAYPDWSLCLAAPQQWTLEYFSSPKMRILLCDYIEPYFYAQSFFERNGGRWPWPPLPHGLKGIVAWFIDNQGRPDAVKETAREVRKLAKKGDKSAIRMVARAMRRNSFIPRERCLCGSKRSYLQCDPCLTRLALAIRNIVA